MAMASSPLDVDDLLSDILARLPLEPSSLFLASLVCGRWRRLVTDPQFLRRRWPPHIGVFFLPKDNHTYNSPPTFLPILDSIPPGDGRFALQYEASEYGYDDDVWLFRGCRHSLLLLVVCSRRNPSYRQALVWDPVSQDPRFLFLPRGFDGIASVALQGAVLCAAAGERHVHGGCHSSPFRFVLPSSAAGNDHQTPTALACVYSSETDSWGDLVTTPVPFETAVTVGSRTVLAGNSVYWFLFGARIKKIFENDSSADCSVHSIHPFTSNYYPPVEYEETVADEGSQGSNISEEAQQ